LAERERQAAVGSQETRIDMAALAKAGLIDWGESHSRAAEEFRIIQNKLLRQSVDENDAPSRARGNLVMVTSAVKGEGKSFASINLAGEVARHRDRRVLLVDADLGGGFRQRLGVSDALGLLDLARDAVDIADVIIPTAADFLDVLPLGTDKKGSAELFASRRMSDAIEALGRRYSDRLIIFDAPPCVSSSVPHTLANVMGQAVLVVAANSTQQADIEAALDLIHACPRISLLLNKMPPWLAHSFGS
jgi:exopolysaccharide/PEP-CTERM locus tyrosine autokinase